MIEQIEKTYPYPTLKNTLILKPTPEIHTATEALPFAHKIGYEYVYWNHCIWFMRSGKAEILYVQKKLTLSDLEEDMDKTEWVWDERTMIPAYNWEKE